MAGHVAGLVVRARSSLPARCLLRFAAINGRDRVLVLGGQAFTTVIPLLIVAAAAASRHGSPRWRTGWPSGSTSPALPLRPSVPCSSGLPARFHRGGGPAGPAVPRHRLFRAGLPYPVRAATRHRRGATIYTLNLPDELAAHASATGDLTRLCGLVEDGRLTAGIEFEGSWRQAGAAIYALLDRRVGGKAVLHVD
jgi:hypothetical protein